MTASGAGQPNAAELLHCLEGLDMGIIIVDGARRIVHWNSWMSRHSGIPRREAVATDLFALFPEMEGGRLASAVEDALCTGLSAVISHHVNADLFPLMRRDGLSEEPVAQSILVRPVQIRGTTGCLIQVYDQTDAIERERKLRTQRNARYHAIVEAAQDCFVTVDEDGLIQGMNPATEAKFGVTQADALGLPVALLLPDVGDVGRLGGPLVATRALGAGGRPFDAEISLGGWISNGLRYHTLFIRDVTERKQAEEELRRSQRLQSLGELTGGIAHEFNNLLMVVRANAELLQHLPGEPDVCELATEIVTAVDRGRSLTDGLLSFARKRSLRPEPMALDTVIADTLRLAVPSLGANVAFDVECATRGVSVHADRTQLQNGILNLLINARDAMPHGGRVVIRIAEDAVAGFCRIEVSDNGVGMAPEVLDRACEPFFTTKGAGRGTGLGLSMVAGFARQSGGGFHLESTPGDGTTAVIRLKLAQDAQPPPASADPLDGPEWKALPKLRILVVEDDPQVRLAVLAMLGPDGHAVTAVADGLDALRCLTDEDFDLLLTDVVLPHGISGAVLAQEARRLVPEPAIVLMSGYNELPAELADVLGSPEILRKPFARKDLERGIVAAMRRRLPPAAGKRTVRQVSGEQG
ncbi:MAG TPA: ATP-binding protein [Azospirillum sp.]